MTDQMGSLLQDQLYYPWGQQWTTAGSPQDLHFASLEQLEPDLGMYPTPHRRYTPTLGRWLTPDPGGAGADPSNPQSWNAYSYALNNPATNTDPDGLDCQYLSSESATSIDVGVERGSCSQQGGLYVNGTVDVNSLTYTGTSLGFSYTNGGVLGTGTIDFRGSGASVDQGLQTLSLAGQMAAPWGNAAGVAFGVFAAFVAPEMMLPEEAAAGGLGLGGTAVIGKIADIAPEFLGPTEHTLDLPDLEHPQSNWVQNSQKLRLEMREGRPIKDATALKYGKDRFNTGFLRMERNLLENHGWTYNNGYWFPPRR